MPTQKKQKMTPENDFREILQETFQKIAHAATENEKHLKKQETNSSMTETETISILIEPLITILGYDKNDLREIRQEYTAKKQTTKGNKRVDIAILQRQDGKAIMVWECKARRVPLGNSGVSQLRGYFKTHRAAIGVLTNGIHYQFYTNIDNPESNEMDNEPFLEYNTGNSLPPNQLDVFEYLRKDKFNLKQIHEIGKEQKDINRIKRVLYSLFLETGPDEFYQITAAMAKLGKGLAESKQIIKSAFIRMVEDGVIPAESTGILYKEKFDEWKTSLSETTVKLFEKLEKYVLSLENVKTNLSSAYKSYAARKQFMQMMYCGGRKKLRILLLGLNVEEMGKAKKSLENTEIQYHGKELRLFIENEDNLERAKPIIERAYEKAYEKTTKRK